MNTQEAQSAGWIKGTVRWYDSASSRGSVEAEDGTSFRIHEFVRYDGEQGALVEFKLKLDTNRPIIDVIRLVEVIK